MKADRRHVLRIGCACLAGPWIAGIVSGCTSTHYIAGTLEGNGITIARAEFSLPEQAAYREYVIVRNEKLEYPICVYRQSENEYKALLMKCTHQGTELQAAGDHLHCPAHGSEYNSSGQVTQGPATDGLRVFPVTVDNEKVVIILK
ncbi:MAG: Rieske (2Fe-2S) protein [Cyclobacteriaceae bacterium]|nr:Rieske (2Fe-2S) protein [Cyclobacteriaceae bacterium]